MPDLLKPALLCSGDRVQIIAPASPFDHEAFRGGVEFLQELGFEPHYRGDIFSEQRFLAGSDARRLEEIHEAFADPKCKAIFCARGGYGSGRLLAQLDHALIQQQPKIFVGFSDVCFLLSYLYTQIGLVSLHGPMIAGSLNRNLNNQSRALFVDLLTREASQTIDLAGETFSAGSCQGTLIPSNLCILQALIGTKYMPDLSGAILCLEDVGEQPYRVDRMLCQLKNVGIFNQLAGVIFGPLGTKDPDWESEVIKEYFTDFSGPIVCGVGYGHHKPYLPLPMGVKAKLDADICQLEIDGFVGG